jgi:hypothetical protein
MNDALDRLRNRNRPKVQQRDASLTASSLDTQAAEHPDVLTARPATIKTVMPRPADIPTSSPLDSQVSGKLDDELQVKRSTVRMEAALTERLHELCRQYGLSREVFIEAMFEYVEADVGILTQVLNEADLKNDYRQQIANRKRAESMMRKFGG